jgi:hypothetical protein
MADCLPSARTCSLVSVIPPQTLLWTVQDKVSVHKAGVADAKFPKMAGAMNCLLLHFTLGKLASLPQGRLLPQGISAAATRCLAAARCVLRVWHPET